MNYYAEKYEGAQISLFFISYKYSAPMAIEKIKILGAVLELPAKQIWPIWPSFEVNGLNWHCCLAGSSKTAPTIFIFSIVLGAEYLSYVKFIETHARAFFNVIIFSIGTVSKMPITCGQ